MITSPRPRPVLVKYAASRRIHCNPQIVASSNMLQAYQSAPSTAKVAFRTGTYIAAFGLSLLIAPQTIINFFNASPSSVPSVGWIRVGGTLASLFGFYYFGAALDDVEGRFPLRFYQATIAGRIFLSLIFTMLVLTGQSDRALLLLAAVNLLSAWSQYKQVKAGQP